MADKKSFILYHDTYDCVKHLSDEQLGKLFRDIFNYSINGEAPNDNETHSIVFPFIKRYIDSDFEKWEDFINISEKLIDKIGGINNG